MSSQIVTAYAFSIIGGYLLSGLAVWLMRIGIDFEQKHRKTLKEHFLLPDFLLGGIERAIATTLFVFAPSALLPFAGGWTALKFATHWKVADGQVVHKARLAFLAGNAVSFCVAILAGYMIEPTAIEHFQ